MTIRAKSFDVDHFKGAASPDLKSALCNLQKFDKKCTEVISEHLYKVTVRIVRLSLKIEKGLYDCFETHKINKTSHSYWFIV